MTGFGRKAMVAALGAAVLATGISVVGVAAQGPAGGGRWNRQDRPFRGCGVMGRGMMGPAAPGGLPLRQLGLTDAQTDQVKAIVESHRAAFEVQRAKLDEARKGLRTAMDAVPVNEPAIREASAALAALQADANVARAAVHAELIGILTAEQKTKLSELKARADTRRTAARERVKARAKSRIDARQKAGA